MPLERNANGHTYIRHPNNQLTHYIRDSFVDPWKPAETIIIQHGFGRHAEFWYHWVPVLSRQYHVIRRDLRGHGRSSYAKEGENYVLDVESIVGEIVDTLDQLGVEKVHFLGESTAGMLGEILAAKHPDRLHSLTICSAPSYLPPPALRLFAFNHADWPTACRSLGSRGWAEALSQVPGTLPISDPLYLPWYLDRISLSDGEGLAQYAEFLSTLDARPYLSEIKVPTLILAPSNSAATSVEEQKGIAEKIECARLEVVEAVGHEIYVTAAETCQGLFLGFLKGLEKEQFQSV